MPRLKHTKGANLDDREAQLFVDGDLRPARTASGSNATPATIGYGILPSQRIRELVAEKQIASLDEIRPDQFQPASLDLRLGRMAHRIRASFLPGPKHSLQSQLSDLVLHTFDISDGAVLEKGCVYLIQLKENLKLKSSISAVANPKSSTGRLDVFTRVITEYGDSFDYVPPKYHGPLYAEVSPRSFSIKVTEGNRLNQIRFRRLAPAHEKHHSFALSDRELKELHADKPLVDGEAVIRNGLHVRVDLGGSKASRLIGYRAQQHTGVVDVQQVGRYAMKDFWEPIYSQTNGRLILDPREFYILASQEALHIPPGFAAEMVPMDPMMGEFRVHYAGFFDPGFGHTEAGGKGSRAVLEVRSHEVPFFLEDGQLVGRLMYEPLAEPSDYLYGQGIGSNYQSQGLKLSKHFIMPEAARRQPNAVDIQISVTTVARKRRRAPAATPASQPAKKQASKRKKR